MESSNKVMGTGNVSGEVAEKFYQAVARRVQANDSAVTPAERQMVERAQEEKQLSLTKIAPNEFSKAEAAPIIGGLVVPYAGTEDPSEAAVKPNHQLRDPIAYGI